MSWTEIGSIQNIVAASIATFAAVIYNITKHRHDKNVFKSQLFFSFNERYEKLQDELDNLVSWEANIEFSPGQGEDLDSVIEDGLSDPYAESQKKFRPINKYISLCSEQYYWYKKGFVDEDVWLSWKDAMVKWHSYLLSFRKIIETEKERNISYYQKDFLSLFPQQLKNINK